MSSIVRSSHVILDNKKFVISTKIVNPIVADLPSATATHENLAQMSESLIKRASDEADSIIANAMEEAQIKIIEANEESERIISNAMDEAKILLDNSYLEGLEKGRREGFEEGRSISETIIQEALEIKNQALFNYAQLLENAESEMADTILEICSKVLNKSMDESDYIIGLIKSAIDKCTFSQNVVLRVSEDDYDYVLIQKNNIIVLCENIDEIEVKVDRSLIKGSCVVESPSGNIDSSIHTQMAYIENRFKELLVSE